MSNLYSVQLTYFNFLRKLLLLRKVLNNKHNFIELIKKMISTLLHIVFSHKRFQTKACSPLTIVVLMEPSSTLSVRKTYMARVAIPHLHSLA